MLFDGLLEPAHWINVATSTSVPRLARFMDHLTGVCPSLSSSSPSPVARKTFSFSTSCRHATRHNVSGRSADATPPRRVLLKEGWSQQPSRAMLGSSRLAATPECACSISTHAHTATIQTLPHPLLPSLSSHSTSNSPHPPPSTLRPPPSTLHPPPSARTLAARKHTCHFRMRLVGDAMHRYNVALPVVSVFPSSNASNVCALAMPHMPPDKLLQGVCVVGRIVRLGHEP